MKKTVIILLVLAAFGAMGWHLYKNWEEKSKAPAHPPALVRTAQVAKRDMPFDLKAVGTMVPYQTVAVRARLDSQIDEVKFHGGDNVKEGDLLFTLDDRTLKAQIDQAASNIARDEAQVESLRVQYERVQSLNTKGFDTQASLDQAKAAYESQKATAAASKAALENLQVQLQYTQIHSPISGRAGTVSLTAGNNVKANDTQPLVTINQIRPIWAQIAIPQNQIGKLREAMGKGTVAATATHDSGAAQQGRLDYLDNAVDETTGTIVARVLFDNGDEVLWPGMFVDVTLRLGIESQALTVPEVAIQRGPDGGDFVFVIENSKAVRKPVKVERIAGGNAVISSGLEGDEQVAVDGMMKLEDGAAVQVAAQGKT